MESLAITKAVEVEAPIDRVWPFIGTASGLGRWFEADVILEGSPGGRYEERGAHSGSPYFIAGTVVKIEAPRELIVSCRIETTPEAMWPVYTTMAFTLESTANGTLVTLVHSGFENLPEDYRDGYLKGFNAGWSATFDHLPAVIETELA
jgi:uncharacterized protein YndB with AHSA1/START domain